MMAVTWAKWMPRIWQSGVGKSLMSAMGSICGLRAREEKEYDGKKVKKTQYALKVIHREMVTEGGKKSVVNTVKGFKVGAQIYNLMYQFVQKAEWGDPRNYDFEVTRTEGKDLFYAVQAMPKSIRPLNDAEKQLVAESDVDLQELFLSKSSGASAPDAPVEGDPYAEPD
jgi:hypothetical protein